jgi:NhaP-type Na+/H+ or K+/H+ antiporter
LDDHLLALGGIITVGMAAQWLAWRIRQPSIFILLVAGFLVGPVLGLINPDELLGDALFPMVSLAVAIILFEGGLSLDIAELRQVGRVVRNLISIGALVTWVTSSFLAFFLLGLPADIAALLGAILVVTGPTVVIPMLRNIRPSAKVASAAKWEGIVNDPTGAILAVLTFDVVIAGGLAGGVWAATSGIVRSIAAGGVAGLLGAGLIVLLLRRYWVPDFLQSPVTLGVVLTAFTFADVASPESGLLAVTIMGSALASQRLVSVRHIVQFKENLRVLLIASLFVLLAARLPLDDPTYRDAGAMVFFGALVLVVRPLAVAASTWRSDLNWRERIFLCFMAPRGIVAAAVASVFSIELVESGRPAGEQLAPIMFLVIVGTVALYGLTAGPAARVLGVASSSPQGVLFLGASRIVREMAHALHRLGIQVVLLDSNWRNIAAARQGGLNAFHGNVLSERTLETLNIDGVGYLLAATPNDEVNALGSLHLSELFARSNTYQLAPQEKAGLNDVPQHLRSRILFGPETTYAKLQERLERGATVKSTDLTDDSSFEAFKGRYRDVATPLFIVSSKRALTIVEAGQKLSPKAGSTVISLVNTKGDD